MKKIKSLFAAFSLAVAPAEQKSIEEFLENDVCLAYSDSPRYDLKQFPYFQLPFEDATSGDYKQLSLNFPTGAGKSTFFEAYLTHIVSNDSGNVVFATNTQQASKQWVDTRLKKVLEHSPATQGIYSALPNNAVTQNLIKFPHMYIKCSTASKGNLQSSSARYVLLDEVFQFKKGIVSEAVARTQSKWNSLVMLVSQSGVVGDEYDKACKEGELMEWSWKCEKCEEFNIYDWADIKYQKITNDNGSINWVETQKTVYMECPCCSKTYEDTISVRRRLSMNSKYISQGIEECKPKTRTYHINCLAVQKESWGENVQKWIQANELKKMNDFSEFKSFIQKRLCQTFVDDRESLSIEDFNLSEYRKKDALDRASFLKNHGDKRIMAVDVQGGGKVSNFMWGVIRDFQKDTGDSRLVFEGRIADWDHLNEIVEKYKVTQQCVYLDAAYAKDLVLTHCLKNKWVGLDGRNSKLDGYKHKDGKVKIWAQPVFHEVGGGVAPKITYAGEVVKDRVNALLMGNTNYNYQLPKDISTDYRTQLKDEKKLQQSDGSWKWTQSPQKNEHLWDAECMCYVGAVLQGIY